MAYTVLARKYRSQTLDDVIGQQPIAVTLANAIKLGRIHHGYLFTGTRGVGKTSMARILAKCLNCLAADRPTVTPCCKCDACSAIAEGQDIDVVEIDAASNTGVDNIRELRGNTAYRPSRSRFKVYIIDEVHMLSTGAFNALLKTLEEPPPHVKFILATTEIQKVPATIQSRCQRFNFRDIAPADIAARLVHVAREEGAAIDEIVARRVARLASGSMRDALSILDQLLAVSPTSVTADVLNEMLPPPQSEQLIRLFESAAAGDAGAALRQADAILGGGRGPEVFCNDAIDLARSLLLLRACGPDSDIVDFPAGDRDAHLALAGRFELSQLVQIIGMLEELRRNVRFSSAGRALLDAVVVRLSRMREWTPIEDLLLQVRGADDAEKKKNAPGLAAPRQPAAADAAARGDVRAVGAIRREALPSAPSVARTLSAANRVAPASAPARVAAGPDREPVPAGGAPVSTAVERLVAPDAGKLLANYDDVPEAAGLAGEQELGAVLRPQPSPAPVHRGPLPPDDLARVRADPVVRQVMELLDGTIINIERLT